MSLTMPQIYMLNHASWVNGKKMDARVKKRSKKDQDPVDEETGKKLDEMTSDEWQKYYTL